MKYAIASDYDRSKGKKREYLSIWSGPFASNYEGEAVSLPKGNGYMVTLAYGRVKVRVECPAPRTDANYNEIDRAINLALTRAQDVNIWGTKRDLIDSDEFCQECEREVPFHYDSCPLYRK
jgi:hypothetical protein